MALNELLKGLLSELNKVSRSDAVVGSVRDAGRAKVVPLSRVSVGFGVASAGVDGKSSTRGDAGLDGSGAGGALMVEPKAFVVVGEDGVPHMLALERGKIAVMRRGIEILPHDAGLGALPEAVKAPALPAGAVAKK